MTTYKFGYWSHLVRRGPEPCRDGWSIRKLITKVVDSPFEVEMDAPECNGSWLRLFLSATDLSEARNMAAIGRELIERAAENELALELEHISELDDGGEARRYNPNGDEIEPDYVDPEFGNVFTSPLRPTPRGEGSTRASEEYRELLESLSQRIHAIMKERQRQG